MARQDGTRKKVGQRFKKTLSTLLVIALVAGGFYGYRRVQDYLNRPEVRLVQAERASFNRTLNLNAQVEAQDSQTVLSPYGLKVQEVLVQEGDFVESGQPLYRYSRSDVNRKLSRVKSSLADLDAKEKERQERFEAIFNEMASELSEQLGVSLQTGAAMLQGALSSFDLKSQLKGLLPDSLEGLGLSKDLIEKTVEAFGRALDAGEAALKEIGDLLGKINSGIPELDKVKLYQLRARLQALGQELQRVHDSATSMLGDGEDLSEEVEAWIQQTLQRAEALQQNLEALNASIDQKLNELSQSAPTVPSAPPANNGGGTLLPTQPPAATEGPDGGTGGAQPGTEGGSGNAEPTPSPSPSTSGESAVGNAQDTVTTAAGAATPDAAGEGAVAPAASPDDGAMTPSEAAPAAPADAGGAPVEESWTQKWFSFLRDSLSLWPTQRVLAESDSSGGGLDKMLGDTSQMNPAMLLALLQMDRSQGQTEREQLEDEQAGLQELLRGDGLTVKATMDGLVAVLKVSEDEAVERGELETLILDDTSLIATCWVGKQDASRLEKGQKVVYNYDDLDIYGEIIYKSAIATQEPSALGGLGSQLGLDGVGDLLGKNIGGGSPKVEIRMSIEGPDLRLLTIGFDLNGEVEIGEVHDVLSIPIESLVQERDQYFVYYVDEDQVLREKEIELGLVGEKRVEVKSGLEDGESIVINAISKLEPGQKVKVVSEDES